MLFSVTPNKQEMKLAKKQNKKTQTLPQNCSHSATVCENKKGKEKKKKKNSPESLTSKIIETYRCGVSLMYS